MTQTNKTFVNSLDLGMYANTENNYLIVDYKEKT